MDNKQGNDMPENDLNSYQEDAAEDREIKNFMEEEIARTPKAPRELAQRLAEHHASSPADSGGDIDANWEDVNDSGEESVGGFNPTPDQSDAEANAHAMGIDYQDNEPLDFLGKVEKRDRDRYELKENSKKRDDSI